MHIIETSRLILRTWTNEDTDALYRINQDPKVLEFLRGPLTMEQIQNFMTFMNQQFEKIDIALWAVEEKANNKMIGYIGLDPLKWESNFTPCVEIGWRLGSEYWSHGYATEGAKAALEYGFNKMDLKEIVSFTVPANIRSIRVMEKIGMKRDIHGDFAHPKLPPDHRLSKHILYRIQR